VALFARLDGLLGHSKRPISPRFEAPVYLVERRFAEGIIRREDVEATLLALAGELEKILTSHGEGARTLDASLFRVDGVVSHIEIGLSRPSRDPRMIARLFREKIAALCAGGEHDPLDAGFGFDVLRLSALAVERLEQEQTHWLVPERESQDLADLVDRLGARLGVRRVTRLAFADTHMPEFAVSAVPAASFSRSHPARPQIPLQNEVPARGGACLPSRPLRLLSRPEPIETLAGVPDGPPLRFRWRRVLHEIAAIEGPERIAPEWWKTETDSFHKLVRDYFRAEDMEGQRFWLFREGLYEAESAPPRWFMHGFFA
jgi:protein ImuB